MNVITKVIGALCLSLGAPVMVATAQEMAVPPVLEGTALFSTNVNACPANAAGASDDDIAQSLQINRSGIFGNEFGCTFVAMYPEKDPESDLVYSWVAIAQCGDDSGITRPDMMTLIPSQDGKQLTVQSQNEFNLASIIALQPPSESGTSVAQNVDYVSATYSLCP